MFFFGRKKKESKPQAQQTAGPKRPKPVVLAIMDGWGIIQAYSGNAISQANLPNYHDLIAKYPATTIKASGESVGLPWNKEGNSEVGHLNLGLGRVLYQDLPRINRSISDQTFYANAAFNKAISHCRETGGKLHLMGLVSSGGIHSSVEHLQALLQLARNQNFQKVYVHAFLDGRDTPYNSAATFMRDLERTIYDLGVGRIATLAGRFYAMDRDNHWDRIEKAYRAMTEGVGNLTESAVEAIEASYAKKIYDEEFIPTVIMENGKPVATIGDNDAIIFFNFRPDRARQITKAFVLPGFDKFARPKLLEKLYYVAMTEYERDLPVDIAYPPEKVRNTLGEVLSKGGITQLRIAETEKYAHVTYFFNGGQEQKFDGESHDLVPSPSVSSYDLKPEMSAFEVTDKLVKAINEDKYDFILVNYANADMVGHTGNLEATIKAVEAVDKCLGRLSQAVLAKNGVMMVTADHGNAEIKVKMQSGEKNKEHTNSPVPFMLIGKEYEGKNIGWPEVVAGDLSLVQPIGVLSDVAPTVLKLFNIDKPYEMTGRSLI